MSCRNTWADKSAWMNPEVCTRRKLDPAGGETQLVVRSVASDLCRREEAGGLKDEKDSRVLMHKRTSKPGEASHNVEGFGRCVSPDSQARPGPIPPLANLPATLAQYSDSDPSWSLFWLDSSCD